MMNSMMFSDPDFYGTSVFDPDTTKPSDPLWMDSLTPFFGNRSRGASQYRGKGVSGSALPIHMHCDIIENEKFYLICAELASLPKEKIVVELDGNDLNLSATKDDCVHDQGGGGDWSCNLGERSFGKVRRVFRIPNYVDKDKYTTGYVNGMLEIRFEKLCTGMGGIKKLTIE